MTTPELEPRQPVSTKQAWAMVASILGTLVVVSTLHARYIVPYILQETDKRYVRLDQMTTVGSRLSELKSSLARLATREVVDERYRTIVARLDRIESTLRDVEKKMTDRG